MKTFQQRKKLNSRLLWNNSFFFKATKSLLIIRKYHIVGKVVALLLLAMLIANYVHCKKTLHKPFTNFRDMQTEDIPPSKGLFFEMLTWYRRCRRGSPGPSSGWEDDPRTFFRKCCWSWRHARSQSPPPSHHKMREIKRCFVLCGMF